MSSDLDTLLEMGFDKSRAEIAVKKGGGLEGAMNWLEKTQDTPLDELLEEDAAGPATATLDEGQTAKSIVCNDCGKKFRNQELAGFHAEKTGHDDFAESIDEIAPLTEEERKARLEEMRAKLAEKRATQSVKDKEDAKANEKIRQKATRETQDVKEELQRKEQIKEAARKRQEKADDLEAKRRIKAKIEADKEARRQKAEEAKAIREGKPVPGASSAPPPAAAAPAASRPAANHSEARLRLQTSSGNVMKTLPAETTLFEVAQQLQSENGVTVNKFVMNFPRKVFEGVDLGKTLKEAGLVPSAALIAQ
ncbi:putative UBX domain-containing protein [Seiridium cardinale]|uniref:UBX domain-containing protein n=1 Tax=Seiridium cardinale TaxID=138064 RepID=A0ABR2Y8N5_9PEZI